MFNTVCNLFFSIIVVIAIIGFVDYVISVIYRAILDARETYKNGSLRYYYVQFYGDIHFLPFVAHSEDELHDTLFPYFQYINKPYNLYEIPFANCEDLSKWEYLGSVYPEVELGTESRNEQNENI